MLDTQSKEIQFAMTVVRRAGQLAQRVQSGMALMGLTKSDFSPVTVGDFAIQALVGQGLEEFFPDDTLVAEETADTLRGEEGSKVLEVTTRFLGRFVESANAEQVCDWVDRGRGAPEGRYWCLDPIDGTKGYLRGGQYAIALALVEDGVVKMGVLGCPNLSTDFTPSALGEGVVVVAHRGNGAWGAPLKDEGAEYAPLHVSTVSEVSKARLLRSLVEKHTNSEQMDALTGHLGIAAEPVRMDSTAKNTVLAAGNGDVLLRLLSNDQPDYRECIWDQAAASVIVEEAGGRVTDLTGAALDFTTGRRLENNRGVLATNGVLHETLLEGLAATGCI